MKIKSTTAQFFTPLYILTQLLYKNANIQNGTSKGGDKKNKEKSNEHPTYIEMQQELTGYLRKGIRMCWDVWVDWRQSSG